MQNNNQGKLQHALNSGFHAQSTATEVIGNTDLTGKLAIVTGGNTGIGLETTKVLAAAGATVVVAARDVDKAHRNLKDVNGVEIEVLDISAPSSINAFSEKFLSTNRPVHLLINNAGIMWVPLRRDSRGIESQLAVNYVGQFQLTARLWPALRQAHGARVVSVSSLGHQMGRLDLADPNFERRPYETLDAYGQSKTACNLFSLALDNRGMPFNVRAYSVHPGSIGGTELGREAPIELFKKMGFLDEHGQMRPEISAGLKNVAQGAATTIWAATSPLLRNIGGVYCEDCDVAELLPADAPRHVFGVLARSLDEQQAERLWHWTEQVTQTRFDLNN